MNRVSASALDLMATALAAIILLYIVTLQEILMHPASVRQKRTMFHIELKEPRCSLGLFYQKEHEVVFPDQEQDTVKFIPKEMPPRGHAHTVLFSVPLDRHLDGRLVFFLHDCHPDLFRSKDLPMTIVINPLGAVTTPRQRYSITRKTPMMQLDLALFARQRFQSAWASYRP